MHAVGVMIRPTMNNIS